MLRFELLALTAGLVCLPLQGTPCSGNLTSNKLLRCIDLQPAIDHGDIPCGITKSGDCGLHSDEEACVFQIGSNVTPSFIFVEWESVEPASGPCMGDEPAPSAGWCNQLADSVSPCQVSESTDVLECPDPVASGVCTINCGPQLQEIDPTVQAAWGEVCRAYALMPQGWDAWTPAAGFFTVGKAYTGTRIGHGTAEEWMWAGELTRTILSPVGVSPLWGAEEGWVRTDWKALKRAGLCTNPNVILGSPYWTALPRGMQRRRALVRCDGTAARREAVFELYGGYGTEQEWQDSGALAPGVVELLQTIDAYELVCITKELADQRRAARAEARFGDL